MECNITWEGELDLFVNRLNQRNHRGYLRGVLQPSWHKILLALFKTKNLEDALPSLVIWFFFQAILGHCWLLWLL